MIMRDVRTFERIKFFVEFDVGDEVKTKRCDDQKVDSISNNFQVKLSDSFVALLIGAHAQRIREKSRRKTIKEIDIRNAVVCGNFGVCVGMSHQKL